MDREQKAPDEVKIIVDTNIVFSGILNSSSRIGKLLLYPRSPFRFYSCDYLQAEISKHRPKLLKLTKLSTEQLSELERLVAMNITFINEGLLPEKLLSETEQLLTGIDVNDTPFVALAEHLKARLWTGDMELYNGLKAKGFNNILATAEIYTLWEELGRP